MGPLKAIALWHPRERHASLGGWIMTAGSVGALAATTPTEIALHYVHWRTLFFVLAGLTFAAAVWIWLAVPDPARPAAAASAREQWAGVRRVFAHPRFWWIAPLGGIATGMLFALQGLWSVPWLIEVNGYDRTVAARHLFVMGTVMFAAYVVLGLFATRLARRGLEARHLFAAGFGLNAAALAAICAELPGTYVWWSFYGLGAATNILSFPVLNEGFASGLAGRANTALNLVMFMGGFGAQWAIGLVVDAARAGLGLGVAGGLKVAFTLALALIVLAYLWFVRGWKRQTGWLNAARPSLGA
jgi:predicted MFS family arabinose efflux permease